MNNQNLIPGQSKIIVEFPPIYSINKNLNGNKIQQIIFRPSKSKVSVEKWSHELIEGFEISLEDTGKSYPDKVICVNSEENLPDDIPFVIKANFDNDHSFDPSILSDPTSRWISHPIIVEIPPDPINYDKEQNLVMKSWANSFSYISEDIEKELPGLRLPQLGGLHAIHAHWSTTNIPGTVVIPTGVGKTETMISALVSKVIPRLLVVVPTDTLRRQISHKFQSLGILPEIGVVKNSTKYPIVGVLNHKPKSVEEVEDFFSKCNVIVTTINIAGQCAQDIQKRMSDYCPYLFIDEAHHVAAPTWKRMKKEFSSSRIIQFTATPFREDGKPVEGKLIYNYPISNAQHDGYFRPITFLPIVEYDPRKRDHAIAEKAIEQLRNDYHLGHILMARAGSISRAKELISIYRQFSEFNPVEMHSQLTLKERRQNRNSLLSGESRIVVCVDMFGEGFDLPELKIAAFHDIRKSLPVTLQLAGRFTRLRQDLGDPTFIANIADINVKEELQKLYSQDSDWNLLLRQTSYESIQEQFDLWEFIEGFSSLPDELSLQNIRPAMSTVVYKTKCESWDPNNVSAGIKGFDKLDRVFHDYNAIEETYILVTAKKELIPWANIEEIFTYNWELLVLYWDKSNELLFIHGSSNSGHYKSIAEAVAGEDVSRISGPSVFRSFSGISRLRLQNVGLLEQLGKLIRYTMRAGSDVELALTETQIRTAIKSNIFGVGFENGAKTTIGCSYKGRIWSRRSSNLKILVDWFNLVGPKLLDETIDPDEILKGTLVPEIINAIPNNKPISIDWPAIINTQPEYVISINILGENIPICSSEIELHNDQNPDSIKFTVRSDYVNSDFLLSIIDNDGQSDFEITELNETNTSINIGSSNYSIVDFFNDYPPLIYYVDGSTLDGNSYVELKTSYPPYTIDKIEDWKWSGINIRKESQGVEKNTNTIQFHVIRKLLEKNYEVIFDDDDAGEVADIVAIKTSDKNVTVDLYHCKYSSSDKPGSRIDDLYDVCGQAQKCVKWMEHPTQLIEHLLRRNPRKREDQEYSRFELGGKNDLITILEKCRSIRTKLRVYIVQPGLSKSSVSVDQLSLLAVTENYLMETYQIPFSVISSS